MAEDDDSEADPVTAVTALAKRGYTIYIEEGGRRRRARSSTLSVSVRSGIDWFELETRDSEDRAVGREEFAALRARGWYERDGEAILLDATTIKRLEGVLALREEMPHGIPATDIASIAEAAALADRYDESVRAVVSLVSSLESDHSTASTPVPITLSGRLRSYQHVGFQHLTRLALHGLSACLADDMGLGKTIQTLAFMLHLREQKPSTFLVIAPVSTLGNWAREAARFAPSLTARVHHGGDRAGTAHELDNAELVVTSYATAQRDFELLSKREWDLLCLDEAQFIKNPLAKRRKIITKIPSRLRLCLTGTPVENITTDLWSIIDFLVPGLLGTMPEFHRRFPKRRSSDRSDNRLERLRRIVSPFVLRRTKEAVAPELPPKIEMTRTCTMGAKQRAFYRRLKEHHRSIVANAILSGDIKAIGAAVFTGLLRLRQAALYPEDAEREGAGVPSTKEEELLSQLEENCAEGHKALVFSQFVSALRRLRDRAVASGVETYYLDGKTTDRESEISGFQNTSGAAVFFVSLKAGGTGINLTAADYVYLCDPWWNPQVERQAVDRAHRIGREKPVVVTKLITAQT
ncbi:MAG: DEAD/DEAH box helicase, partial [Spirochaetales bacterium]